MKYIDIDKLKKYYGDIKSEKLKVSFINIISNYIISPQHYYDRLKLLDIFYGDNLSKLSTSPTSTINTYLNPMYYKLLGDFDDLLLTLIENTLSNFLNGESGVIPTTFLLDLDIILTEQDVIKRDRLIKIINIKQQT